MDAKAVTQELMNLLYTADEDSPLWLGDQEVLKLETFEEAEVLTSDAGFVITTTQGRIGITVEVR
ncbi:MAG: hypothetical protein ACYC5O_12060 [Anaerolineae bacterium]